MLQIYIELLYLLGQRGTDVRLLRWASITEAGILVTPTKTEASSGKTVLLPMTDVIKGILEKSRSLTTVKSEKSEYVIHDRKGQAYEHHTLKNRFVVVCQTVGYKGFTLKDIRPKMATDARNQGYKVDDIKTTLAHTDTATTLGYLRGRVVDVSSIRMELPGKRTLVPPADVADGEKQ
jgi:integrase